jgi:hypothetical protein
MGYNIYHHGLNIPQWVFHIPNSIPEDSTMCLRLFCRDNMLVKSPATTFAQFYSSDKRIWLLEYASTMVYRYVARVVRKDFQ